MARASAHSPHAVADNTDTGFKHVINVFKRILSDDPRNQRQSLAEDQMAPAKSYDPMAGRHNAAFTRVFTPSGIDTVERTFNGRKINGPSFDSDDVALFRDFAIAYQKSRITKWATFLGLPTYLSHADLSYKDLPAGADPRTEREFKVKQTWTNVLLQFLGYKQSRGWWNILTVPFFTLFNLLTMLPKLALNIARVFTELLPFYVQEYSRNYASNAWFMVKVFLGLNPRERERTPGTIVLDLCLLPFVLAFAAFASSIALVAALTHYVGGALTSPWNSVRGDWKYWRTHHYRTPLLLRFINDWVTAPLAVLLRLFTFGAVIAVIAFFAAPALAALAPSVTAAIPFLAPVFSGLTTAVTATTSALIGSIPSVLTVASLGAAQAFVAGALVGAAAAVADAVGAIARPLVSMFTNWLHREEPKGTSPSSPLPTSPSPAGAAMAVAAAPAPASTLSIRQRLSDAIERVRTSASEALEGIADAMHSKKPESAAADSSFEHGSAAVPVVIGPTESPATMFHDAAARVPALATDAPAPAPAPNIYGTLAF